MKYCLRFLGVVFAFSEFLSPLAASGANEETIFCCFRNCRTGVQHCKKIPREDGCFVPMCKTKTIEEEVPVDDLFLPEEGRRGNNSSYQSEGENSMNDEKVSIEGVINNYFHAYLEADPEVILKSFDKDTRLLTTENRKLEKTEMSEWVENLKQRREKGDIRTAITKILGVEMVGDMAFVKTSLQFEKFTFFDYLSLLKIDGSWKIVGKVYTVQ